jgi:hypothetical protein
MFNMTHTVLVKRSVAAADNRALNRSAFSGSAVTDIDNGQVFNLNSQGTAGSALEVWLVTMPVSGSLGGLWMAASPMIPITVDGTLVYRGLNSDPRNFYNVGGKVFDAFKPQPGDIIEVTADALDSGTAQAFATAAAQNMDLVWAAAPAGTGTFCLRYLSTTYISIGSGDIDNQRVASFKFEVLYN